MKAYKTKSLNNEGDRVSAEYLFNNEAFEYQEWVTYNQIVGQKGSMSTPK